MAEINGDLRYHSSRLESTEIGLARAHLQFDRHFRRSRPASVHHADLRGYLLGQRAECGYPDGSMTAVICLV